MDSEVEIDRDELRVVDGLDGDVTASVVMQEIFGGGAAADPGGGEAEGPL